MKLSEYAKACSVTYRTAHRWYAAGLIPGAYITPKGSIVVPDSALPSKGENEKEERIVTYARVSSAANRKNLATQSARVGEFCAARGWVVAQEYKEVASGMNDTRKQLIKMIESNPTKIVFENKDRLTRFGYNYLEMLLAKQGCELVCINVNKDDEEDLIKDLVSIITSFCCRLYGLRRGHNKAKAITSSIREEDHE